MRRGPIVIITSAVGLAAVLSFRTHPAPLALGKVGVTASKGTTSSSGSRRSKSGAAGTTTTTAPGSVGKSNSSTTTTTTTSGGTRSATGPAVNYSYGVLSVSVTVSGHKLTRVSIASLDDGDNFRSQSIDEQAIPILEDEAIQAQSANIQGVSGASYTSAGFVQSLQGALRDLGL